MRMTIKLAADSYERLLHKISEESPVYKLLKRIIFPDRRRKARLGEMFKGVLLRSSREEVLLILGAVRQHCPEAVGEFENALAD